MGAARMAVPLPAEGALVPAWSQGTPFCRRPAACRVAVPQPKMRSSAKMAAMRRA